jgi:hypothetical protein
MSFSIFIFLFQPRNLFQPIGPIHFLIPFSFSFPLLLAQQRFGPPSPSQPATLPSLLLGHTPPFGPFGLYQVQLPFSLAPPVQPSRHLGPFVHTAQFGPLATRSSPSFGTRDEAATAFSWCHRRCAVGLLHRKMSCHNVSTSSPPLTGVAPSSPPKNRSH